MPQFDYDNIDPSTKSGAQLASDLNNFRDARDSNNKGAAAPSYLRSGLFWLDDSASPILVLKIYDGAQWIPFMQINAASDTATAYIAGEVPSSAFGTAAFLDTGTDTGEIPTVDDLGNLAFLDLIGTSNLDDASVTTVKIGNLQVTTGKLADNAVTTGKVADRAITLAKQATGTANRIQGWDNDGNPSEYTAGTNVTITGGAINASGGLASVSQGNLNTSQGTVSGSVTSHAKQNGIGQRGDVEPVVDSTTLPGGTYAFSMEVKADNASRSFVVGLGCNSTSYQRKMGYIECQGTADGQAGMRERYVTSSPPVILEGETAGWLYLLMRGGKFRAHYFADVPPFVYNGPTNCGMAYKCPITKKKYRKKTQGNIIEQIKAKKLPLNLADFNADLDDRVDALMADSGKRELARISSTVSKKTFAIKKDLYEAEIRGNFRKQVLMNDYELITNEMKLADMEEIPHPWVGGLLPGDEVLLVGLYDPVLRDLVIAQNQGEDFFKELKEGTFYPSNEYKNYQGPKGVKFVDLLIK